MGISDITPIALNYLADTGDGVGNDQYESYVCIRAGLEPGSEFPGFPGGTFIQLNFFLRN